MRAILNGYEIEEELYRAVLPHRDWNGVKLALTKYTNDSTPEWSEYFKNEGRQQFTLDEIEAIDPRYLAFKEKVE